MLSEASSSCLRVPASSTPVVEPPPPWAPNSSPEGFGEICSASSRSLPTKRFIGSGRARRTRARERTRGGGGVEERGSFNLTHGGAFDEETASSESVDKKQNTTKQIQHEDEVVRQAGVKKKTSARSEIGHRRACLPPPCLPQHYRWSNILVGLASPHPNKSLGVQ